MMPLFDVFAWQARNCLFTCNYFQDYLHIQMWQMSIKNKCWLYLFRNRVHLDEWSNVYLYCNLTFVLLILKCLLDRVMLTTGLGFNCQGVEVQLDQDHLTFGAVVQRCQARRRIVMMNTGDIGAR